MDDLPVELWEIIIGFRQKVSAYKSCILVNKIVSTATIKWISRIPFVCKISISAVGTNIVNCKYCFESKCSHRGNMYPDNITNTGISRLVPKHKRIEHEGNNIMISKKDILESRYLCYGNTTICIPLKINKLFYYNYNMQKHVEVRYDYYRSNYYAMCF